MCGMPLCCHLLCIINRHHVLRCVLEARFASCCCRLPLKGCGLSRERAASACAQQCRFTAIANSQTTTHDRVPNISALSVFAQQ